MINKLYEHTVSIKIVILYLETVTDRAGADGMIFYKDRSRESLARETRF